MKCPKCGYETTQSVRGYYKNPSDMTFSTLANYYWDRGGGRNWVFPIMLKDGTFKA